jgi:DsbC/DsbD-like thiol-disulfide interchange protein
MNQRLIVAAGVLLLATTQLLAVSPGNAKVSVKLIADTAKIEAGKPFTIGVHLTIAPQWHIYWKNPGESGLPTVVDLKLPQGFTATPWQYPTPIAFDLGGVQSYGYANSVTLIATVTPPANLTETAPHIEATVNFLVCSDVCLPGKITVPLELGGTDDAELIHEARQQLPQSVASPVKWTTSKTDDGWTHMQVETDKSGAQWFPNPPDGVLIRDPKVEHGKISFDTKKQGGAEVKEKSFESVLSYNDFTKEAGVRRGILIDVPVPQ